MKISKIITHGGNFHADELLAIATIRYFLPDMWDVPIERTFRPSEEDFNDPSVIVLDIGRRNELELNNFDHHQSSEVPATNMLVLYAFCHDVRVRAKIAYNLFYYVDKVDRGAIVERKDPTRGYNIPTFPSIIRSLNNPHTDNFEVALKLAETVLEGAVQSADLEVASEDIWERDVIKSSGVAFIDDSSRIINWQTLAESYEVYYLVTPNQRGGYQIMSRNSDHYPIPVDDRQNFRHNSGFLAVYETRDDALKHARELAKIYYK